MEFGVEWYVAGLFSYQHWKQNLINALLSQQSLHAHARVRVESNHILHNYPGVIVNWTTFLGKRGWEDKYSCISSEGNTPS